MLTIQGPGPAGPRSRPLPGSRPRIVSMLTIDRWSPPVARARGERPRSGKSRGRSPRRLPDGELEGSVRAPLEQSQPSRARGASALPLEQQPSRARGERPRSPRTRSMRRSGLRHLRHAEAHHARVRRDAVGVRLTRERALSVLHVAVVRAARHVVGALECDRPGNSHLSARGRGRRGRSGSRLGVTRGRAHRLLVRRRGLRIRAGLLRIGPGLLGVPVRGRAGRRRGGLLRSVLLRATRRKHHEKRCHSGTSRNRSHAQSP